MPALARRLCAAATSAAVMLLCAAPASADLRADTAALADEAAAAWAGAQAPDGRFMDVLAKRTLGTYGHEMLAYSLMRSAQRTGNGAVYEAGVRAYAAGLPPVPTAFDGWSTAVAYRGLDAPADLRGRFASHMSQYAEPWHRVGVYNCADTDCYGNLVMLDGLAVMTASNNGIAGVRAGQPAAVAQALHMVNTQVPAVADGRLRATVEGTRLSGSVLSDPDPNPLAYHALSTFAYAQAVREAGAGASPQAVATLREALDAMSVLVAPDGDLSYYGRGQGQVWVPAATLAAAVEGARYFAPSDPVRAGRYLAVAHRALAHLQEDYRTGGWLKLVPGEDVRVDKRGVDSYADLVTYNGLALFALQAAVDAAAELPAGLPAVGLPADSPKLRVLDSRATGLAVVRKGDVWMAVHKAHTHPKDTRYDFGLLALKVRTPDGRWVDALAPRPYTHERKESAGPVLTSGSRSGIPHGSSIKVTRAGEVVIRGGFRNGSRWLRRGVTFKYTPTRSGVRLRVGGLGRRSKLRVRVFTAAGSAYRERRAVVANGAYVSVPAGAAVATRRGFHSAQLPDMDAFDIRMRPAGTSMQLTWRTN